MVLPFAKEPPEASTRAAECLLPATGAGVAAARALVRRELPSWGAEALVDDCVLVVGELAANVVRHGGAAFTLRLAGDGAGIRGEIFDPGEGVPRARLSGPGATDGRGLLIVGALTDEWGVRPGRYGKTVWFVVGGARRGAGHPDYPDYSGRSDYPDYSDCPARPDRFAFANRASARAAISSGACRELSAVRSATSLK